MNDIHARPTSESDVGSPVPHPAAPAQLDELGGVLRRERQLLEILLFRLVETRLLLGAGEMRFLPWAASEVERAVERLRDLELHRATVVHRLAGELGLPDDTLTLSALATETPEPYRTVFEDHRRAFLELVTEIEALTRENRNMAGQGMRSVQDVLSMIDTGAPGGDGVTLYGPDAHTRAAPRASGVRFDSTL